MPSPTHIRSALTTKSSPDCTTSAPHTSTAAAAIEAGSGASASSAAAPSVYHVSPTRSRTRSGFICPRTISGRHVRMLAESTSSGTTDGSRSTSIGITASTTGRA